MPRRRRTSPHERPHTATQPELGSRTGRFIDQDGLRFRDLDGDGVLSPYEDWRLSPEQRAQDLVQRMFTEAKAGLMVIGSRYPGTSSFLPEPSESLLNENDVWRSENPITGVPFAEPVLVTSSSENAINVRHQRYLVVRDNLKPRELATWTNAVQELAEASAHGIPAVFASNPHYHVALVAQFGVNESAGVFSEWPGELGLAALDDDELVEDLGAGSPRNGGPAASRSSTATWRIWPRSRAGRGSTGPSARTRSRSPGTSAPWCAGCRARS